MEKDIFKSLFIFLLIMGISTNLNGQIVEKTKLIDIENSNIKWVGEELSGKNHYGSLKFKSGSLKVEEGKIISGNFVVDMNTLNVEDLQGGSKQRLEGHLRSDDFFSVQKFGEAIFEITSSGVLKEDGSSQILNGNLTIKGITNPGKIEVRCYFSKNCSQLLIDNNWAAKLIFDRSKYDVRFRSGNFFQNLGDKLIYDEIVITANISIKK